MLTAETPVHNNIRESLVPKAKLKKQCLIVCSHWVLTNNMYVLYPMEEPRKSEKMFFEFLVSRDM